MSKDESPKLNVFRAVNDLRRARANIVNTYGNYKLLFMCLEHYGTNKSYYDKVEPIKTSANTPKPSFDRPNINESAEAMHSTHYDNTNGEEDNDDENMDECYVEYNI